MRVGNREDRSSRRAMPNLEVASDSALCVEQVRLVHSTSLHRATLLLARLVHLTLQKDARLGRELELKWEL